jgi:hypothetical protein
LIANRHKQSTEKQTDTSKLYSMMKDVDFFTTQVTIQASKD